jgi:hypothetical protein
MFQENVEIVRASYEASASVFWRMKIAAKTIRAMMT